jgi:hypothetical protein
MGTTQTTYATNIAPPEAGVIAGSDFAVETGICETAAPGIGFGLAVSQGSLSNQGVILGGTLAGFRGVSVRDVTLKGDSVSLDHYVPPNNVAILKHGPIWAQPNTAVAANDPVWFNSVTGQLGNATGTNMLGPVKGARWVTSCGVAGSAIAQFADYNLAG